MIFDRQALFSDAQAITASAASANVYDFGPVDSSSQRKDFGKGDPTSLLIQVVETFDSVADDGTLNIALQLDSTTTFTPDKSIDLGTYAQATLVAGYQIPFDKLPRGISLRYARLYYTVAGSGNFTAGKITAGIVHGVQSNGVSI
ncbi:MAG: hypothetical protein HC900_00055 [Methylacidiphilales bacterium]|nr:hypothetical protein [Candidatus Methylacidiphilales bacterium]